jgi:mono/diheme cytochrome c family protein
MTRSILMRLCSKRIACLVGVLMVFAAYGWTDALAEELSETQSLSHGWRFEEKDGAELYARVCAACHQSDAKGAIGAASYPALAENKNLASAAYIESVLLDGLRGMPPLGRMMSDDQVAAVINFVRGHFGNSYEDTIAAKDVGALRPR